MPDQFLQRLEDERDRLLDAARLLEIPNESPYRARERELGARIREHVEMMRS